MNPLSTEFQSFATRVIGLALRKKISLSVVGCTEDNIFGQFSSPNTGLLLLHFLFGLALEPEEAVEQDIIALIESGEFYADDDQGIDPDDEEWDESQIPEYVPPILW